jgi:hypothetical protein
MKNRIFFVLTAAAVFFAACNADNSGAEEAAILDTGPRYSISVIPEKQVDGGMIALANTGGIVTISPAGRVKAGTTVKLSVHPELIAAAAADGPVGEGGSGQDYWFVKSISGSYSMEGGPERTNVSFRPASGVTNEWTFRMTPGDLTITVDFTQDYPDEKTPLEEGIRVNPGRITLQKGVSAYQFAAYTVDDGETAGRAAVRWTLDPPASGGFAEGTAIGLDSGLLSIGAAETNTALTVRAVAGDGAYGTALVTVNENGEGGAPVTDKGVTISPATAQVIRGATRSFTANTAVIWSVDEPHHAGTTITAQGELSVSGNEDDGTLVVRAVSQARNGDYGTALVTVMPVSDFTAQTNNNTANDEATLGLVGTGVSSSATGVATAVISGGRIAVTSVSPGTAVITVSATNYTNATIPVAVAANGGITIGTITKGSLNSASAGSPNFTAGEGGASLKTKFGITTTGKAGVEDTFKAVSAFIRSGQFTSGQTKIHLGDWIDLENGLAVSGSFSIGAGTGGARHLIVVGVNSFNRVSGAASNDNHYPHVVFQFKDIPVNSSMNSWDTNTGGYPATAMRTYLTGAFFTGLTNAGVPDEVVWASTRTVSTQYNGMGTATITDKLWLPTRREVFGDGGGGQSPSSETEGNQARLEYYKDDYAKCIKNYEGTPDFYWLASIAGDNYPWFCAATAYSPSTGYNRSSFDNASKTYGVVPAFCVH